MYKKLKQIAGEEQQVIYRIADGGFIPFAKDNTDYQEYLKWLAEGNEPLPADEEK